MDVRRCTDTSRSTSAAAALLAPTLAVALATALLTCAPASASPTGAHGTQYPGDFQRSHESAPRAAAAPRTTIRFRNARRYVVTYRVGKRVVRGSGRLPLGIDRRHVRVRPARNVLGTSKVEVLLRLGPVNQDPLARAWTLHTLHRGKLRPVMLGRYQLMLVIHTEGGDDAGFRCRRGKLLAHWFHYGSGKGEVYSYRLVGAKVRQVGTRSITRPVVSRPSSCA